MDNAKKHLEFLDRIRAIACISVFLFHSFMYAFFPRLPWAGWVPDFTSIGSFWFLLPFNFGWAGVSVFFVVSGFCIHLSFRRNPNWRDFTIRRFFRIYPPYLFALLLFALFWPWTHIHWGLESVIQLASHLTLLHDYSDKTWYWFNGSFWSIAVEVQLYLLYPVLLGLVARFGWHRTLVAIAMLEISLRSIWNLIYLFTGVEWPFYLLGSPFVYWYSWSIGAVIAEAYLLGRTIPFANHSLIAWGGAAICSYFLKPLTFFSFLFFALLTATAIAKLLSRGDRVPRYLSFPLFFSKSLSMIGLWSYSIYLLHQPIIANLSVLIVTKLSLPPSPIVFFTVCLCLWFPIIGLSAFWYRKIEIPSLAIGRQLIRK